MNVNSITPTGNESIELSRIDLVENRLQNLFLQESNNPEIIKLSGTPVNSTYSYCNNQGFIEKIIVRVSPEKTSSNYLELHVNQKITLEIPVNTVVELANEYINNRLQGIEVNIKTLTVDNSPFLYLSRLSDLGMTYFQCLVIPKHEDARKVVERLWQHNQFYGNNMPEIGSALDNLEECVRLSKKINDNAELTIAQKYIIKNRASLYIKEIKEEISDIKDAKSYLNLATEIINDISPHRNVIKDDVYHHRVLNCYPKKSYFFYNHLFGLAKIGSMWAGLEKTLEQAGESLPSRRQLNDIILQTMDEAYNTVQ